MLRPLLARPLCALLMLLPPAWAHALEVGPLQVFSAAGQALVAEIPVSGSAQELADMSAQIASPELYARAGQTRSAFAAGITPSIERKAPQQALILLRSAGPVPAGQTVLLMDLRWPGGGLVRGYAFALDAAAEAPPVAPAPAPRQPAAVRTPVPGETADGGYLTQPGDTLGAIAQRIGDASDIARRRAAILALNRQHFVAGDPDRLRAGVLLRLPTAAELAQYEASPAVAPAPATTPGPVRPEGESRLHIRAARSDPNAPDERLLTLEENLATQSRIADERDKRIHALEETVSQLGALVVMQQHQLAALSGSVPVAKAEPDAPPLALSPRLQASPEANAASRAWYRRPWVQAGVVAFAVLSFGVLAFTETRHRLRLRRRRAQGRKSRGSSRTPSSLDR